ncbi:hypothetical protein [Amycolatopsis nigrescens]|uniref:hypothetical protein n=1 Tax=Amycolatopsis nigrescens TaxID=381445 RepID=UPI00035EE8B5|nr:hypothetical protein [Amycolatopsis nigrescens]
MTGQHDVPQYRAAELRRALAEDARTVELGIRVFVRGRQVHLCGEVATEGRRAALAEVLHELAPDLLVRNDVRVMSAEAPAGREELR